MFKIEGKTIHCTRGDRGQINLKVPSGEDGYYTFQPGDKVDFIIKPKNGFHLDACTCHKSVMIEQASDTVQILLEACDTKVGELINKPVAYWYDIVLNGDRTLVGYDEEGPKEFILYPESGEDGE